MSDTDSSSSESVRQPRPRIKPQKLSVQRMLPVKQPSIQDTPMQSVDDADGQVDSFFRRASTHYLNNNVSVLLSDDSDDESTTTNAKLTNGAADVCHITKTCDRLTTTSNRSTASRNIIISDNDDDKVNDANDDHDDDERERSLTPPPEFAMLCSKGRKLSTQYSGEYDNDNNNAHLVAEENEIDTANLVDLDPELQEIASDIPQQIDISTTQKGESSNHSAKIDILIKTIRHPQLPVTTQNALQLAEFERPLIFSMHVTEPFEALLDGYCRCKQLARNNVVLVFKNVRLYPHGTPHSLGITGNIEIEAFTVDTFEYISMERELSRKRRLAELVSVEDENSTVLAGSHSSQASNETTTWIHLKIRDKAGHDEKLRVKPTTLVSTIISKYIRIRQLPKTANIRLELEGDILDPQHKVGDTDVEDDDMLTAIVL